MTELDAPPWLRFESTLMATSKAIRRAYDERLAPVGVNLTEGLLIAIVDDAGPVVQSRLAERLGIGRVAVGKMIDGLEARGLIARHADESDRRVRLVSLTAEGRRVAAAVVAVDIELRATLREGLTKADRSQLARLLVRVQRNLLPIAPGE